MIAEGELSIDVTCANGQVDCVMLNSTRRTDISRVLEGKPVTEALRIVPLLFSLCGRAQAIAAVTAAEQALGQGADSETRELRRWLILAEQTQEYLLRLLVDLPAAFGAAGAVAMLAEFRQSIARLFKTVQSGSSGHLPGEQLVKPADVEMVAISGQLETCLESMVFGLALCEWRAIETAADFRRWMDECETVVTRSLRHFAAEERGIACSLGYLSAKNAGRSLQSVIESLLEDTDFAASPVWQGRHPETGALARRHTAPLIDALAAARCDRRLLRSAARLLELADAVAALRGVAASDSTPESLGGGSLGAGTGYGWVETARGLLIHALRLTEDRVAAYRILAPTEWNFHPSGPLANELKSLRAANSGDLEQQARLAVLALDPCVGFKVRVRDA